MCGICGIFYLDARHHVEPEVLARMNARLIHRGPDDEGFFVEANVGLGMRRLSIIDLRTGHQPIASEDGSLWTVYNGEIYNHRQLRLQLEARGHSYRTQSDTETIIHLYEEYRCECVNHLRGMFAFAIWDRRQRVLFVARDRLGIKPLYYAYDGGRFLFASEVKAILAYPGVKAEFNQAALAEYLAFGYLSGPDTMFRGIKKLLPGHTLELNEHGEMKIEPYWDMPRGPETSIRPRSHYVSAYRELLEESVTSHLMSDVPLGVFLSGGLDSSAVAALTTKIRREPIETFSVGYKEAAYSELSYARQVASHIGSRHYEVLLDRDDFFKILPALVWHEDEPITWPSSVSLYFVARLARERVKVVLTGEGSDETLGGYARYAWTLWNSRMGGIYRILMPAWLRHRVLQGINASPLGASWHRKLEHTFLMRDGRAWPSFYFDNFYSAFSAQDAAELLTEPTRLAAEDAYVSTMRYWMESSGHLLHRMLYTDIKTYLVELLMKQDQMSMAASIESRVPFLDHVLVEFTASIPAKYSVRWKTGKCILKSAVEDLLPKSVVYRQKMGFPTPWAHWLSGTHLDRVERTLLSPRASARGLFEPAAIRRLFVEHRARHRDHGNRIWRLLNLETWLRVCIDGEIPATLGATRAPLSTTSELAPSA